MYRFIRICLAALAVAMITNVGVANAAPAAAGIQATQPVLSSVALNPAAADKFKSSWSWYVSRASGIVAAVLLALLIASGVGMLTGATYKILEPLPAWATHRSLGIAFAAVSAVHVLVLLFDKFVGFSWADLLVPFYSDYKPFSIGGLEVGSLAMALGILSLYGVAAIIITTWLFMQRRPHVWRRFHFLSYAVLAAVFAHALMMGTDLRDGWGKTIWIILALGLLVVVAGRLRRTHTIGKDT